MDPEWSLLRHKRENWTANLAFAVPSLSPFPDNASTRAKDHELGTHARKLAKNL